MRDSSESKIAQFDLQANNKGRSFKEIVKWKWSAHVKSRPFSCRMLVTTSRTCKEQVKFFDVEHRDLVADSVSKKPRFRLEIWGEAYICLHFITKLK